MNNHEHDRFIQDENTTFIFGCINPFCGHGNPLLPNRYKVPKRTKEVEMKLLMHINRKLMIEVRLLDTNKINIIECPDDLEACSKAFADLKNEIKGIE